MKKISKNIYNAVKFYKEENINNLSITEIGKKFGVGRHVIAKYGDYYYDLFQKFNIEFEDNMYYFDEKDWKAVKLYTEENKNLTEIERILNMKPETTRARLKILNIEQRGMFKYFYNRDYFEKIDSENKAYWLGFITADGCIAKNGASISIQLGRKDIGHLKKFCDEIQAPYSLIKDTIGGFGTECNKLAISSVKMNQDLQDKGIHPAKSLHEKPYLSLDEKYIKHYIRGLIDGDGYISTCKIEFGFCGSEDMCNFLLQYFKKISPYEINVHVRNEDRLFRLSIGAKSVVSYLLNYLYNNEFTSLDRKYELAKQYFTN